MKKILPFCLLSLIFCACRKDRPPLPKEGIPPAITLSAGRLMILNEGNFMMGNAGLSMYSFSDRSSHEDIFRSANNHVLGDVGQSMNLFGGDLWIAVNNSSKIVVIDTSDFKEKKMITGMQSPRYMLSLSGKVLVSDLYARRIHVLDERTQSYSGHIPFHTWSEEMAFNDAGVWISAPYSRHIYRMQSPYTQISDSLEIGYRCSWLEQEADGRISGLSAGQGNEAPHLWTIDRVGRLIRNMQLPFATQTLHDLEFIGDSHYFLGPEGLYRLANNDISLVFPSGGRNFYSMTWFDNRGILAIADAKDYVSKGEVLLLGIDGENVKQLGTVNAGIIPGRMLVFDK